MIDRHAGRIWAWAAVAGLCGVFALLLSGGWSGLTGGAGIAFQTTGHAGAIDFDPSSCRSDTEGLIYIALGRVVLGLPEVEVNLEVMSKLLEGDDRAKLPRPPDSKEPPGCPGNPLQIFGFYFHGKYKEHSGVLFEQLRLTALPFDLPARVASATDWFEHNCASGQEKEELPNGLDACYWPPSDRSVSPVSRAVRYKAPLEIHSTPKGQPFIVDCYPRNAETAAQKCYVRYKLFEAVSIYYVVDTIDVPITRIIEFDRRLRARIEAAYVADFVWFDEGR